MDRETVRNSPMRETGEHGGETERGNAVDSGRNNRGQRCAEQEHPPVRYRTPPCFCTEGNRDDLRQPVELRGAVEACDQEGVASCRPAGQ